MFHSFSKVNAMKLSSSNKKIDWKQIKTENDLRNLKATFGTLNNIKKQLSSDLGIKITGRKYIHIFNHIQRFKEIFVCENSKQMNQENFSIKNNVNDKDFSCIDSHYFLTEQHCITYVLLRLEGSQRMDMLGVTDKHWKDEKLVQAWFRKLSKLVHPDYNKINGAEIAMQKLEKIRNDLLSHAKKFGNH